MKKRIALIITLSLLLCRGGDLEDAFTEFYGRYDLKSEADAMAAAFDAVEKMESMMDEVEKSDSLLMEYVLAKDYCLTKCGEKQSKKKSYSTLLERVKNIYREDKSPFLDYSLAILYGRVGESSNMIDAVKANVPNNIKKHAERVLDERPEIDGYGAYLILGRLNAVTPKVIYFTSWPSLKKSEESLLKYVEKNPLTVIGRLYLAETYGMMKEDEKRDSLIDEIISFKPENKRFYEDRAIIDSLKELSQ